jgi:Asp-tRNA(Asn)/Glu-tRNA(Gln) amidotransferase C subunit
MISIEKCRKLLEIDKEKFTEDEIIKIKEQLYKIAEFALDSYFEPKK